MKSYDHSVTIVWSEERGAYIANVPEFPGCLAEGQTWEQALANLRVMANEWLNKARAERRKLPQPMSREDYEHLAATRAEALWRQIQSNASAAPQDLEQVRFDPADLHRRG